jgi:hypothetical protein
MRGGTAPIVALVLLAGLAAGQANVNRILLDCPISTQTDTATVRATYYSGGALSCGSLSLWANVSGVITYNFTTLCNDGTGRYLFDNVTTDNTGSYTLTALTSNANATCTLARVRSSLPTSIPEFSPWLAPALALAALALLRRRR